MSLWNIEFGGTQITESDWSSWTYTSTEKPKPLQTKTKKVKNPTVDEQNLYSLAEARRKREQRQRK